MHETRPASDPKWIPPAPLFVLAVALALGAGGCAQVPPLETPPEIEAMRAEWEAEAEPEDGSEGETAAARDAEAPYVIDTPPPYPGEVAGAAPSAEPTGATAQGEPEGGAAAGEGDRTVIRIETATREREPRTLYEASRKAKMERKTAAKARIAITDENLHEYQGGNVTIGAAAGAPDDASAPAEAGEGEVGEGGETGLDEEYWRSAVLDIRLRLRAAVDELAELEDRATDLRRSFYAQDDPFVRDGEIKPAWDRTLDRIEEARGEILVLTRELDTVLAEGRRAGALPGWLREGAELEPEPDELPRDRAETVHEPGEPRVIESEEPPG